MSRKKKNSKGDLKRVLANSDKRFGKGSLMLMDSNVERSVEVFSTGSVGLDQALGVGGLPRGRIVEIYGPESSGKTTLTLHCIAEIQRLGAVAAFIDAEHAFDPVYAEALGVQLDKLLLSQPDCGEDALDMVDMLARSGEVGLVVVDSVAALIPRAELDGEMSDAQVGLQARMMGKGLRKLTGVASQTNTTIIFINQLRQKIGVMFGSNETTTGGNALKFYASVRLDIRRIGGLKNGDGQLFGNRTRVRVIKNKVAPPFKSCEFDIRYGEGVCTAGEVLDLGVARGVIEKSGAWFSRGEERLGQGRERARAKLLASPQLMADVRRALSSPDSPQEPSKLALEAA